MGTYLFSVIIPTYNSEEFLTETLNSLLNQTEKNFEVIIIDDGSADNTKEIVLGFKEKLNLKYFYQENSGQLISRRNGVKKANGEYILFLDADDYLRNDALQILSTIVLDFCPSIILFNAMRFSRNCVEPFLPPLLEGEGPIQIDNKEFFINKILNTKELNNLCLKCTKRSLFLKVLKTNLIEANLEEDLVEFARLVKYIDNAIYINEKIYFYRLNEKSITNSFNEKYYLSIRNVSQELESEFINYNIQDYENVISNRFIREIYGSLIQIADSKCKKNHKNKIKYIANISNDPYFREKVDIYLRNSHFDHRTLLLLFLYKKKYEITYILIYVIYHIRKIKRHK